VATPPNQIQEGGEAKKFVEFVKPKDKAPLLNIQNQQDSFESVKAFLGVIDERVPVYTREKSVHEHPIATMNRRNSRYDEDIMKTLQNVKKNEIHTIQENPSPEPTSLPSVSTPIPDLNSNNIVGIPKNGRRSSRFPIPEAHTIDGRSNLMMPIQETRNTNLNQTPQYILAMKPLRPISPKPTQLEIENEKKFEEQFMPSNSVPKKEHIYNVGIEPFSGVLNWDDSIKSGTVFANVHTNTIYPTKKELRPRTVMRELLVVQDYPKLNNQDQAAGVSSFYSGGKRERENNRYGSLVTHVPTRKASNYHR
jgi:hypothetical protein